MELSACGMLVRAGDPVRFRTALFAPPDERERLFALYAFNLEIAKIAPLVSEPMLGEIRLQWWRETLDQIYSGGNIRAHEVVGALARSIHAAELPRVPLDALIDARAADLDPSFPSDGSALHRYIADTSGGLTMLAAKALAPEIAEQGEKVAANAGFAIGASRYLMAMPKLVARGRKALPMTLVDALAAEGRERLDRARVDRDVVPKAGAPALLEAVIARHALCSSVPRSLFRERLSLLWHGVLGRW